MRMASKVALLLVVAINLRTSLGFSAVASPPRVKDTKVAVDGKATVAIIPPPNNDALLHNVTLTNYMQLPVEQYVLIPMPLGSSLTRIEDGGSNGVFASKSVDDTEFELVVPTITFFKLSLQPVVYATVQPQKNRVVISSTRCILRGSPFIEKVQLNDRFDFSVNTTLTWEDSLSQTNNIGQGNNQNEWIDDDEGMGDDDSFSCSITAETCIHVDVDVPRPFNAIPKRVLERTGNAAMKLSLKYIQANFVDNLAKDYNKWATCLDYRAYRASLSEKVVVDNDHLLVEVGETMA